MKKLTPIVLLILFLSLPIKVYAKEEADTDTWLSAEIQSYCTEIGEMYNVCPELLMAIIERESWGIATVSNGNCKGLMQVNEPFHKDRMKKLNVTNLYNPHDNILVATDYLMELAQEYDVAEALLCYNMGETNAQKMFDKNIFMNDYSEKILARAEELERVHGKLPQNY